MDAQDYIKIGISLAVLAVIVFSAGVSIISESQDMNYTKSLSNESFTAGSDVDLDNSPIVNGSETVYNNSITFVESGNYTMDYTNGSISTISGTQLVNGSTYFIDYDYKQDYYTGVDRTLMGLVITMLALGLMYATYEFVIRRVL